MQTEIAGLLDIRHNTQWLFEVTKRWSKIMLAISSTRIAQQMFQVMMSKFATDKSRFERPSSVQEINGELYVKGAKKMQLNKLK